jgi:Ni,Fe-hydrogenase III large subunit/Ni,Fe-hydrogenase III component G
MSAFSSLPTAFADVLRVPPGPSSAPVWRTVGENQLQVAIGPEEARPIAELLRDRFAAELVAIVANDGRRWSGAFHVHYLFAQAAENWYVHATASLPPDDPRIVSLASFHYPASRFEREIFDLFGIRADGHPDPRPLVRHGFWPGDYFPLRKDAAVPPLLDDGRGFPFGQVAGEGVFEIPVGPVHAGVIEPGHFRFSVVGETIIDMKSRLYYTHKGVEKLFEGQAPAEAVRLAERISGDTTIGHALAYCQAAEAAAGIEAPPRARFLRTALLELERLHNHVADFGMIANDTGFAVAQSHCARIREGLLALNKRWTGSRLLRGAIVPGGTAVDWPRDVDIAGAVAASLADFRSVVDICLANTLLDDRLEGTGRLFTKTARDHGVLGYVARASGVDRDVRRDHPFAAYRHVSFRVPVFTGGDVRARALVRVEEAVESVSIVRQVARSLPAGPTSVALPPLPAFAPAFSQVEGWRGAILHWVMADESGRLERVKVVDPSFLNWRPLSYALLGNIVPDFPLCNKSFNQSYSGNDL